MNTLFALSLLLAPPSPTPNPLAPAIAVYPDCAKDTDNARALACDYGVRLLSREPRKATVLFVAMWSSAIFARPTVTSADGLHIAPADAAPGPTVVVQREVVVNPLAPAVPTDLPTLAGALIATGAAAGLEAMQRADTKHEKEIDRKVWTALLREVYRRGNDDYSRSMLDALGKIDWTSPDSIDRFVAAHEAALAAEAAQSAPAQPTPPTQP